jgi:hypothetical protein
VKGCWNGDREFVGIFVDLFPISRADLPASAADGETVKVPGGVMTHVMHGNEPGSWIFTPSLASARKLLGQSEESIVRRLLRRVRPETLRQTAKGPKGEKVVQEAKVGPAIVMPLLKFDSRRGRRKLV